MSRAKRAGITLALTVLLATAAGAEFSVDQCVEARLPDGSPFKQGKVTEIAGTNISVSFDDGSGMTVPVTWHDGQELVKACGANAAPPVTATPASPAGGPAMATGTRCRDAASTCPATNDVQQDQICAHNQVRNCEGLGDLSWNAAVAESARAWADTLEREGRMYHGDGSGKRIGVLFVNAENISPGETSLQAFSLWADEEAYHDKMMATHGKCHPSIGSDYARCGHWENIVNKQSSQLGCGMAGTYLVCQFAY